MKFIFFVESGPAIGLGHIKRSLLLAHELNNLGAEVTFAADALDKTGKTLVESAGFQTLTLEKSKFSAEESIVVDGYNLVIDEIRDYFQNSKFIVLEDYCHRSFTADIVIDANLSRPEHKLSDCRISAQKWLTGKEYLIVEPKYVMSSNGRNDKTKDEQNQSLFMNLGSGDIDGLSSQILEAYAKYSLDKPMIDLLPGPHFPEARLTEIRNHFGHILGEILSPTFQMEKIYSNYTLAIGAAGTSAYERLASGIYSLNIIGNENQVRVGFGLASAGLALSFDARNDFNHRDFSNLLDRLLKGIKKESQDSKFMPDGRGQKRLAHEIVTFLSN